MQTGRNSKANRSPASTISISPGGLLLFHGLAYVPRALRKEVIRRHHDGPTNEDLGIDTTQLLLPAPKKGSRALCLQQDKSLQAKTIWRIEDPGYGKSAVDINCVGLHSEATKVDGALDQSQV